MRFFVHLIVAVAVVSTASAVLAADGPKRRSDSGHGCIVRCPNCCHECVFSANKEKVTKSCYDVVCKDICIPRIVFPWQKGCCSCAKGGKDGDGKDGCCAIHNGAKTKSVRVLKKYEYECARCKYKWTPVPKYSGEKKPFDTRQEEAPESGAVPSPPPVDARILHRKPIVERTVSHSR
jgi:hypothetical protein